MSSISSCNPRTRPNKTDAGNGSKAICRVSNVLRSPSPDPGRSPNFDAPLAMPLHRRLIGATMLFVISAALTAFWNDFVAMIYDFAANLYYAGFATVAVSLCFHLFVVRRILPRSSFPCLLLGVAISGLVSIVLYDLLRGYTEHITYLQREGSSVNWGDDGQFSGLGHYALGIHWPFFLRHLPITLTSGCLYGVVWFPCLVWLERWSYSDHHQTTDANHHETQAA